MMASRNHDEFAIVGLGVTKVGHVPGYSGRALETEAARLAIEDAGLKREDIDGCIHTTMEAAGGTPAGTWTDAYPRVLGLPVKFYYFVGRGGAAAIYALCSSMEFLRRGIAKYVIVAYATNSWSKSQSRKRSGESRNVSRPGLWGESQGAVAAASFHSLFASRHMFEFGTTSRQLGAIAVSGRTWACLNPASFMYGRPITIEDHQSSPVIVWPYHMLDICLQSDGGTAFIVTTAERAKECRKPPVYIKGIGFGEQMRKLWWEKGNYTQLDIEPAKEAAFKQAGITLKDIDVAEFYDCFTSEVLFQLEGYGWCKKGEGGPFVAEGNTLPGRTISVNTGGGLLSSHHLGDFTGLAEAVIQLRNEGGARQVKNTEIALVTGHGGEVLGGEMCSTHGTLILGK